MILRAIPAFAVFAALPSVVMFADQGGTALVRHAPTVNATVDGSLQQMSAESVTLNGGASISGSLFVPGQPSVRVNGGATYGGLVTGSGAATPTNYTVTMNGRSQLGHLQNRTDPVAIPAVSAPPAPTGTRNVTLNHSSDSAGDFATVRNLTVNGSTGAIAVPPGNYGDFTANSSSGFVLGIAGATQPAVYSFQHLTLNGSGSLQVVGPVIVTVANSVSINNGDVGAATNPEWLLLRVASGDFTINGSVKVYAYAAVPSGTVTLNASAEMTGGVMADALVSNGSSVLHLIDLPPIVAMTAPADHTVVTAPAASISLAASADDLDGYITKVEFFSGTDKLGEATTAPYQFAWTNVAAGTYQVAAKATDNAGGATTSAPVTLIVNAPPTVSLTLPLNNAVIPAPNDVTLVASASDSDGTVAKVEFFQNGVNVGAVTTPPYQITLPALGSGAYQFTATATDNYGAPGTSAPVTVHLDIPPTTAVTAPPSAAQGAGVTISATSSDADDSVAKVEFYRDKALLGTVLSPTSPGLYSYTDTTPLAPGIYSYWERTYDSFGLSTDSKTVLVQILPTLPYTADFEIKEGYAAGVLDRQLGWTATAGASITAQAAFSGTQSVVMAPGVPPTQISQTFAAQSGQSVVFVDFYARPVADTDVTKANTFDVGSARFGLLRVDANGQLQAFNGDGAGGGQWLATKFAVPLGSDGQATNWLRLTARLDFARKTWDLYANGSMVAADLGFRDASATYLTSFVVTGHSSASSALDYLFAGADNPLFADVNGDGIDDAWETKYGLSLTTNDRNLSPSGSGVTVVQAFIAGTDPNDYYSGVPPAVTLSGLALQVGRRGSSGPWPVAIQVANASSAAILVNAPVTFVLDSGEAALVANATDLIGKSSVVVRTGSDGIAHAWYKPAAGLASATTVAGRIFIEGVSVRESDAQIVPTVDSPDLASGPDQSLWIDSQGVGRAWGRNAAGQLGDGTATSRSQMMRLGAVSGALQSAAFGALHGLAVTATGQVYAWGDDYFGQLGDGAAGTRRTPAVVSGLPNIVQVAAGDSHSLALAADGTVWGWGGNQWGQLGDGTTVNRPVPQKVIGLPVVVRIAAGAHYSAAVGADGSVWVWGGNEFSQLATTGNASNARPAAVPGLANIVTLIAGRQHVLALRNDGAVFAWGDNHGGQLGNGTTLSSAAPQRVANLPVTVGLAAGSSDSLALGMDGVLRVWGANESGQLGTGTTQAALAPVALSITNVRSISAGADHVIVLKTDGTLRAWGLNTYGQLGIAAGPPSSSPVQVASPVD